MSIVEGARTRANEPARPEEPAARLACVEQHPGTPYPEEMGVARITVGKATDWYWVDILPVPPSVGLYAVSWQKGPKADTYHVLARHDGTASCDCPGGTFRGRCKHAAATLALVAAGQLTPPRPAG